MNTCVVDIKPSSLNNMDALTGDTPDSERIDYHASCQCGMVQYSVRMRPLGKQKVIKDNCSICVRYGFIFAYATRSDVHWKQGYKSLKSFGFNTRKREHKFCPECGSSMILDLNNTLPKDLLGLNIRMINDIEPERLPVLLVDGTQHGD